MLDSLFSKTQKSPSQRDFIMKLLIMLGFTAVLAFAWSILHILASLAFAAFLVMLFSPFLNWCNRHRIGDGIWIVLVYLGILGIIILIFASIIPIFIEQIDKFFYHLSVWFGGLQRKYELLGIDGFGLPSFITTFLPAVDWSDILGLFKSQLSALGSTTAANLRSLMGGGLNILSSVGATLLNIVTSFVFAFFLALERHAVRNFFYDFLPEETSRYIESRETSIMQMLSWWLRGQAILSLAMFLCVYIGLWILHAFGIVIEHKFTLALLAGLLESVPYLGPFLALIPALALAGGISWTAVFSVLGLYIGIQQLEGQVLVPFIMSKSLDLSPFFVLVMMAVGGTIAGIPGIFLAVPAAATIEIGVRDFLSWKKSLSAQVKH